MTHAVVPRAGSESLKSSRELRRTPGEQENSSHLGDWLFLLLIIVQFVVINGIRLIFSPTRLRDEMSIALASRLNTD